MTLAFLYLRASFAGLAKTVDAMFPGFRLQSHDWYRGLEHGWFLHSCLVAAWQDAFIGQEFDLRMDFLDSTLAAYERRLHDVLHARAAAHSCPLCQNPVIAGDGGMKLTTRICNERGSSVLTSPHLQVSVLTGCTRRPLRRSLFCKEHQVPSAAGLPPEIRDHKLVRGEMLFRYHGTSDFLPLHQVHSVRLRQYDSRLRLTAYAAADPSRFVEPNLHEA